MSQGIIMCEAPSSDLSHPIPYTNMKRYTYTNATERSRIAFTYLVATHVEDAEPPMQNPTGEGGGWT